MFETVAVNLSSDHYQPRLQAQPRRPNHQAAEGTYIYVNTLLFVLGIKIVHISCTHYILLYFPDYNNTVFLTIHPMSFLSIFVCSYHYKETNDAKQFKSKDVGVDKDILKLGSFFLSFFSFLLLLFIVNLFTISTYLI